MFLELIHAPRDLIHSFGLQGGEELAPVPLEIGPQLGKVNVVEEKPAVVDGSRKVESESGERIERQYRRDSRLEIDPHPPPATGTSLIDHEVTRGDRISAPCLPYESVETGLGEMPLQRAHDSLDEGLEEIALGLSPRSREGEMATIDELGEEFEGTLFFVPAPPEEAGNAQPISKPVGDKMTQYQAAGMGAADRRFAPGVGIGSAGQKAQEKPCGASIDEDLADESKTAGAAIQENFRRSALAELDGSRSLLSLGYRPKTGLARSYIDERNGLGTR